VRLGEARLCVAEKKDGWRQCQSCDGTDDPNANRRAASRPDAAARRPGLPDRWLHSNFPVKNRNRPFADLIRTRRFGQQAGWAAPGLARFAK
jgi:hypothetical protein